MPTTITLHRIEDLAEGSAENEILLSTNPSTKIYIAAKEDITIIAFPYGSEFEVVNGCIVIHSK